MRRTSGGASRSSSAVSEASGAVAPESASDSAEGPPLLERKQRIQPRGSIFEIDEDLMRAAVWVELPDRCQPGAHGEEPRHLARGVLLEGVRVRLGKGASKEGVFERPAPPEVTKRLLGVLGRRWQRRRRLPSAGQYSGTHKRGIRSILQSSAVSGSPPRPTRAAVARRRSLKKRLLGVLGRRWQRRRRMPSAEQYSRTCKRRIRRSCSPASFQCVENAPGGIRTPDPRLRRPPLFH